VLQYDYGVWLDGYLAQKPLDQPETVGS
jgi:hypothetical protein